MNFFYTTPAGYYDALLIATICSLALLVGGRDLRLCAVTILGVFLSDRLAIYYLPEEIQIAFSTSFVQLLAGTLLLAFVTLKRWQFFASLFYAKIGFYIAYALSLDFSLLANGETAIVMIQLAILLTGAFGNGIGIIKRVWTIRVHDGNRGGLHHVEAVWVQGIRHTGPHRYSQGMDVENPWPHR